MRKISADLVFLVDRPPLKNGVVVIDEQGKVLDIYQEPAHVKSSDTEYYQGVIVPGFVNAHSHLEYSYVKGLIEPKQGFTGFIKNIAKIKARTPVDYQAIVDADKYMYEQGIVAVGDHTNTLITKDIKAGSKIYYHSFVELYRVISEINSAKADFYHGLAYLSALNNQGSITGHAPYSVTPELMQYIFEHARKTRGIISIHNQETKGEYEMFKYGRGEFFQFLQQTNANIYWVPAGTTSLEWILQFFSDQHNLLLIHNTFTTEEDLLLACNKYKRLHWVFCPGSNLYIEDRLPDVGIFIKHKCNVALGTDSYASNTDLSILFEMRILQQAYDLDFFTLLYWGTMGGAKALELEHKFGSITVGKTPGLVLLQNIDLEKLIITETTTIQRLA